MAKKEIKRYSLTFKQQVVQEYEAGETVTSLMRKYGITGNQTIRTWISQYSRKGNSAPMKQITDPHVQAEMETLKNKVESMEKLIAQLSLDKFMLESCLKVAERELGYEVKKSDVMKRPNKPLPTGRRGK